MKHLPFLTLSALLGAAYVAPLHADPILFQPLPMLKFDPIMIQLPEGKISFTNLPDIPASQIEDSLKFMQSGGYFIQSIYAYGPKSAEKFGLLMAKQDGAPAPEQIVQVRSLSEKNGALQIPNGYGAQIVAATGDVAVWVMQKGAKNVIPGYESSTQALFDDLSKNIRQDYRLVSVASFGAAAAPQFRTVWQKNFDGVAWNMDAIGVTTAQAQERFNVMQRAKVFLRGVNYTPNGGIIQNWSDEDFGQWASYADMTLDGLKTKINEQKAAGLVPISIAATSPNGDGAPRFAAVFAQSLSPHARKFSAQSKPGEKAIAEVDELVRQMMQNSGVRNASLAVCLGTRLIYVRAYTLGGTGDVATTPDTTFRQASVVKPFVAAAIYRLINAGAVIPGTAQKLTLDTPLQDVLKLTTPDNKEPSDDFKAVTIRHLLAHKSGLDVYGIQSDVAIAQAFGAQLPVSPAQVASYVAAQPVEPAPSMANPVVYNNTGYVMLGLVAAKMTGKATAFDAISQLVFAPLGLKTATMSRTSIDRQPASEVAYIPRQVFFETDNKSPSRNTYIGFGNDMSKPDAPTCALGYGETNMENCTGSGGVSMNAIDAVRLGAALSAETNNPLFSPAERIAFLDDITAPGGRYGFDWCQKQAGTPASYVGVKGGSLSTSGNTLFFQTGGLSFSLSTNVFALKGPSFYPTNDAMMQAISSKNWDGVDLFPKYGYASLTPSTLNPKLQLPNFPPLSLDTINLSPPGRPMPTINAEVRPLPLPRPGGLRNLPRVRQ